MREQLLAYLLDDLNPVERSSVEAALAESPELQQELEKLRECLGGCEAPVVDQEPVQLASRTCHFVEHAIQKSKVLCNHSSGLKTLSESHDPLVRPTRWSPADIGVGICVLLALAALVFPALKQDQETAKILACQNNLSMIGGALMENAYIHNTGLPSISEDETSEVFVLTLVKNGAMRREELTKLLICPSGETAERVARGCIKIYFPTPEEYAQASPKKRECYRRSMVSDYAFSLGYLDKTTGKIRQAHFSGSRYVPMVADAPSHSIAGYQSANHGGGGQNVLNQDLSCEFKTTCKCKKQKDHLYLNDKGEVAPGCHPDDTVLVPLGTKPVFNLTAGK
jgi:hypothetical protein